MNDLDFIENRETIQPSAAYELMPKGRYSAYVKETELKDNSKRTGKVLTITYKITEEGFAGREVKHYFNVANESTEAQEIGLGQLSACGKACGFGGIPASSLQFIDCPLVLAITIKPGSGINPKTGEAYNPSNKINGWYAVAGALISPAIAATAIPGTKTEDEVVNDIFG